MALLHSIQRSDFEHDVVHHGEGTTSAGKAAKPQFCRVLFLPGGVSPGLMVITPPRPNCLARQKNIPGQMISLKVNTL
ncbi:MAG: hypothetical protein IH901_03960 [Proteobacteria bacterium]|nr:hypothetical protein [Pseudomonadota bacterium]